ncbi:DUF4381 domain-containing protein [Shewanella eurypsychrophilus]|uniref:DUF4381 domain-containing protein n=1 Tax=Shewanella eurypsychrophilus TaxID=2593656 RepID=A0ABX6V787_9GAMM|nr:MULTISPECIES: DUF4381 domain-containing protein [Shewanella]QFU23276.1 DUF4381 family protein [Shewanella sp. YLB-09]QPG58505.1 DUF4381 domain-containing protein [Shewanella eurypsychrophilus]
MNALPVLQAAIEVDSSFGNPMMKMAQFEELSLPTEVSLLPQTWGWALLLLLVAIGLTVFAIKKGQHWRKNRYRKQLIEQLNSIEQSSGHLDRQVLTILHLGVSAAYGVQGSQARSLTGGEWLAFLDLCCDGKTQFHSQWGLDWQRACWMKPEEVPKTQQQNSSLVAEARQWLLSHSEQLPTQAIYGSDPVGQHANDMLIDASGAKS